MLAQNAGVHTRAALLVQWIGIPAVAVLALLPGLRSGPSLDAAVFGLVGRQIVGGAVPYVDAWDHKPPGVYLVHGLAEVLPWLPAWSWAWLLTVIATCVTAWLAVAIVRRHIRPSLALLMGATVALGLGHVPLSLGGGMSESFAVLPATGAIALIAGRVTRGRAIAAGVLVGIAVIVSPQLAAVGAGAAIGVLGAGFVVTGLLLIGAGIPVAVMAVALASVGALPEFVDAFVTYNAAYRAAAGPGLSVLPWAVLALIVLIAPALAGALSLRRASEPLRKLGFMALTWVLVAVVLVGIQGRFYGHYVLAVVVPLGLLAAIGLEDATRRLGRSPAVRLAAALVGAGLLAISLAAGAAAARMELAMIEAMNERARAVGEWAEEHEPGGGAILVWGNAPQVYLATGSPPATRYGYLYPLATRGYATDATVTGALADLEAAPPTLVVDAGSDAPGQPGFLPLLVARPVATDGRDLDLLDPIRAFVGDRYELAATVEGWPIYRLVDTGG